MADLTGSYCVVSSGNPLMAFNTFAEATVHALELSRRMGGARLLVVYVASSIEVAEETSEMRLGRTARGHRTSAEAATT